MCNVGHTAAVDCKMIITFQLSMMNKFNGLLKLNIIDKPINWQKKQIPNQ